MNLATIATAGLTFDEPTHIYRLDGVVLPSVTQVLDFAGKRDDFSRVSASTLEAARQRGVAVHAAAHYHDDGDLDESTLDPIVRPYLEAWKAFVRERQVEMLALELIVAEPALGFAGTIDRIARMPGYDAVVLDIKTGTTAGANLQTAAYAKLAATLRVIRNPFRIARMAVTLHPESRVPYRVHPYRDSHDWPEFLEALRKMRAEGPEEFRRNAGRRKAS